MPQRTALFLAVAWLALPAQAELVEVDLNAPGDGLVTRDTETGLDWLDLGGVTTNLSYDAIQGGAGGWLAAGWRYATEAEVCDLFVEHTEAPTCNFNSGVIPEPAAAENLIFLLETTGTTFGPLEFSFFVTGLYDDATGGATGEAKIEVVGTFPPSEFWLLRTRATPDATPSSTTSTTVGSFLVRATPPEIPALPSAGAAALVVLLGLATRRAASR
jgi:hypothetical protein